MSQPLLPGDPPTTIDIGEMTASQVILYEVAKGVISSIPKSVLHNIHHCDSLIIIGNLAALRYAEANLPSFRSGEADMQHALSRIDTVSTPQWIEPAKWDAQNSKLHVGCQLALHLDDDTLCQKDSKRVLSKLGNSLVLMPSDLKGEMIVLLRRPPRPVLFASLQVLFEIQLEQTLSSFLRHCPRIRKLSGVTTQPEAQCAWAQL